MLETLGLLQNVGKFDSVAAGRQLPLARLTVIYAENGRGKTTLAGILRSLASGAPDAILERHRLGADHDPHVVIQLQGGNSAVFQSGRWTLTLPDIAIFDDVFVDENLYSGLVVDPAHRQRLHELIIGARGVSLTQQLEGLVRQIEQHNSALREKAGAIPDRVRGGITVGQFCALAPRPNIEQEIEAAEKALAAARDSSQVSEASEFQSFGLPALDIDNVRAALAAQMTDVDAAAMDQVASRLAALGRDGEAWVSKGMSFIEHSHATNSDCPFCAKDLVGSPVIDAYRSYFSDAYRSHVETISRQLESICSKHSRDVFAGFERIVRTTGQDSQFWSKYETMPELDIDTAAVVRAWRQAVDAIEKALREKLMSPLEPTALSEEAERLLAAYYGIRDDVSAQSDQMVAANRLITAVKERAADASPSDLERDLERLRSVRERHTARISRLCDDYLREKAAKAATEADRDSIKRELDEYRTTAFPNHETSINAYLAKFNAGFRVGQFKASDNRGGPTCTYNVVINNTPIAISSGGSAAAPSFRTALSSGDRNTLALAFFFSMLDQDPGLANKIVVIDDPISSLDEHRALTTVQQVRALGEGVAQVVVLSHSRTFLCKVWESSDPSARTALQVIRDGDGSTLSPWDVAADSETEHDRRHRLLTSYAQTAAEEHRVVAKSIRPHLESFIRVAYPGDFPASRLLGPFLNVCRQRVGTPREILSSQDVDELGRLLEYANKFHHDTNPAYETETINDGELHGFVQRTLAFTRR